MGNTTKVAAKIAGNIVLGSTLTNFLMKKVEASSNEVDAAGKKDLDALNQEAARQKIEMELALQHARVAQEPCTGRAHSNGADALGNCRCGREHRQ